MEEIKNMIEIDRLSKSFGEVKAVRDISFRVKAGELFAFLGVNGAGKSTTINMLCGELSPDSGSIKIDGEALSENPSGIKRKMGVVFQGSRLDRALSVYDNLESRAALYGILGEDFRTRLSELAALLEFSDLLHRPVGKLSGGQRRRIDIARALLHNPKILILDEPTTGLDPQTRRLLWDVITELRKTQGLTVFLTTHYMEEAAEADYIVILDGGRICAEDTPIALKNKHTADTVTLYGIDEEAVTVLGLPFEALREGYRISVPSTAFATEMILSHPALFTDYEITKGKMDDVFLAVTGKALTKGEEK